MPDLFTLMHASWDAYRKELLSLFHLIRIPRISCFIVPNAAAVCLPSIAGLTAMSER